MEFVLPARTNRSKDFSALFILQNTTDQKLRLRILGLEGKTPAQECRGCGFKSRYTQIHSGLDSHIKRWSSVIGPYPLWQDKEPQGH